MQKILILLAGGVGRRAGGSVPKQLMLLDGKPVLWHSMKRFKEADPDTKIILVMHPGLFDDWDVAFDMLSDEDKIDYTLSCGGRTRTESVAHGLMTLQEILGVKDIGEWNLKENSEVLVAVHDAARPLIPLDVICRAWESIEPGVCVVPTVPCSSSLRKKDADGTSHNVNRAEYCEVQTPQCATAADIIKAYNNPPAGEYTDDASLLQATGMKVRLIEGNPLNIKITYPLDIKIAATILKCGE